MAGLVAHSLHASGSCCRDLVSTGFSRAAVPHATLSSVSAGRIPHHNPVKCLGPTLLFGVANYPRPRGRVRGVISFGANDTGLMLVFTFSSTMLSLIVRKAICHAEMRPCCVVPHHDGDTQRMLDVSYCRLRTVLC